MADPTDPTTNTTATTAAMNDQTQALGQLTQAVKTQTEAYRGLEPVGDLVKRGMEGIEKAAKDAGVSLDNLSALSDQQTEKFAVLTSAFIKAREAFSGFSNVDYSGLSTFSGQIDVLREALLSGGNAASTAGQAISLLVGQLKTAGVGQDKINQAMQKGSIAVLDLAQNMLVHADNMARAQTAYVQMAARTGELGNIMQKAGEGLEGMNIELEKQQTMLDKTRQSTGLTAKQTEAWYNQLGLIPGALNSNIALGTKDAQTTSMLTAVIETAVGSGRDMADVMKDLNTAFKDYGLVGEKALLFSVRMHDVSTNLKAPIEDVTSALRGSADAFKMFATGQENASSSAESLAKTLNEYGAALESTGLSATAAVEVASNLSNQVAKLNTGQLAFISQQTGGAGGILGAAQETLKLQTDPGAVVKDAMRTLQQQFGQIVTVKDAVESGSEAAASQNLKQTLMLQSLLGPMAKDQASANRLLEAMKNNDEGQLKSLAQLKPDAVKDVAQQGVDMQKKTYGAITQIVNLVEQIRDIGDRGASSIMGKTTAADIPDTQAKTLTLFESRLKNNLAGTMQIARMQGGSQVKETAEEFKTGLRSSGGADAAANIHQALSGAQNIPLFLEASFDSLTGTFRSGSKDDQNQQVAILKELVEGRKQLVKQLEGNPKAQAEAMGELKGYQALLDASSVLKTSHNESANQKIRSFIPYTGHVTAPNTPGTGAAPAHVPGATNPNTLHIIGKITIDCPFCGKAHDASNQFKAYTGPAGQSQQ